MLASFLEIKRPEGVKNKVESLSPLRNYPAQSFAGREKRGGGAICTRINGTVAGTIQECGDLEETQDILRLLDVSNWAF